MVTVALCHLSNSDMGVPTILERPRTTALDPSMGTPLRLMSSRDPAGVHETKPVLRSPVDSLPSLMVPRPSTSLR